MIVSFAVFLLSRTRATAFRARTTSTEEETIFRTCGRHLTEGHFVVVFVVGFALDDDEVFFVDDVVVVVDGNSEREEGLKNNRSPDDSKSGR